MKKHISKLKAHLGEDMPFFSVFIFPAMEALVKTLRAGFLAYGEPCSWRRPESIRSFSNSENGELRIGRRTSGLLS